MRKRILFLLTCIFALIGVVKADVAVTGLTDSKTDYVIGKGEQITLSPQITPADATNKNIVFSVDDNNCVSVSNEGVVTTTIQNGSCDVTVTATSEADNTKKYDYRIHVVNKLTIHGNGGVSNCNFTGNTSSYGSWYYESTADGLIIRKDESLSITETIHDLDNSCTLEKDNYYFAGFYTEAEGGELVSVYSKLSEVSEVYVHWSSTPIEIENIELSTYWNPEIFHKVAINSTDGNGKRNQIRLRVLPTPYYASSAEITWTSSNPEIASVDNTGLVTGHAVGEVTITAKTSNNIAAAFEIVVTDEDNIHLIVPENQTIFVGDIVEYKIYQIGPLYVDTNDYVIEISDVSIANFVDASKKDGKIKGLKAGKVTITAKLGGNTVATTELTVKGGGSHQAEDIKFMIKFEGGEGVDQNSTMLDQAVYVGETTTINKNLFTKKGYVFAGWAVYIEKADGTRIAAKLNDKQMMYKDGEDISKLSIPEGATLVLVATWVTNPDTGAIVPLAIVSLGLIAIYLFFIKSRKFNKIGNI